MGRIFSCIGVFALLTTIASGQDLFEQSNDLLVREIDNTYRRGLDFLASSQDASRGCWVGCRWHCLALTSFPPVLPKRSSPKAPLSLSSVTRTSEPDWLTIGGGSWLAVRTAGNRSGGYSLRGLHPFFRQPSAISFLRSNSLPLVLLVSRMSRGGGRRTPTIRRRDETVPAAGLVAWPAARR